MGSDAGSDVKNIRSSSMLYFTSENIFLYFTMIENI